VVGGKVFPSLLYLPQIQYECFPRIWHLLYRTTSSTSLIIPTKKKAFEESRISKSIESLEVSNGVRDIRVGSQYDRKVYADN
jgi:hypothetical protein